MYCCQCLREADIDSAWEPLKMYKVPDIKHEGPMGKIVGWDIYCEDCIEDWLEQFRKEEE